MTKENNLIYYIVNATKTFLLVLRCFKWELLVTIASYYHSLCQWRNSLKRWGRRYLQKYSVPH